ncbi:MAG: MBL fold metallo-hydrolase [Clostridia bacterium]|nr:MBL fold metallo-hydrolase [Clostridia bacterium]
MELIINGCSGGYPSDKRACSSYLLKVNGKNILFDLGPGSLVNLQKHIDIEDIDLIVLSHLHFDHYSDLLPMSYSFGMRQKSGIDVKPIPIIFPFNNSSDKAIRESDRFTSINLKDNLEYTFEGIYFKFFVTCHPAECYASRIECEGKIIVYTGDMNANTKNTDELFKNADLAIMDCGELDYLNKPQKAHLTPSECYHFAKENNVKKTILGHIIPHYSIEKYNEECFNLPDWNYIIAEDNKTFEI